jgi:hypothetical protein
VRSKARMGMMMPRRGSDIAECSFSARPSIQMKRGQKNEASISVLCAYSKVSARTTSHMTATGMRVVHG